MAVSRDSGLKVLLVSSSAARRGAEIEAAELASQLERRGMSATAVALWKGGAENSLDVDTLGTAPLGLRTLWRLRKRALEVDVVVAYGSKSLPACAVALLWSGVPFVYRSIGDPIFWAGGRIRRLRTSVLLRRARSCVALWPAAGQALRELYWLRPCKVEVIPNGRDGERYQPPTVEERIAARSMIGGDENRVVVGIIGALEPEKDVGRAIRCGLAVPNSLVVVAGDGTLLSELQGRFAGERVRWLGSISDVRAVLWSVDVVVNTSKSEGLSGAILEAAMCGVPVVATAVGAVADGEFDNAVVVLPDQIEESGARDLVISAVSCTQRLQNPQRFSWNTVSGQWESLLMHVVARGER